MDTRTKLLLSAERLIALHGANGAALREIVNEAGVKNASALHYHFGSREGVIEAVCVLRMAPIDEVRLRDVADFLDRNPPAHLRLRRLVEIIVRPAIEQLVEAKGESYFRRFVAQASMSEGFGALVRGRFDRGLQQVSMLIRAELSYLDPAVADARTAMVIRSSSFLSAHLELRCAQGRRAKRRRMLEREIEIMIDGFVGFLAAADQPVTRQNGNGPVKKIPREETLT